MMLALSGGLRAEASPGEHGECPGCRAPVIAKCGSVNVWHWAHRADVDCDQWAEGETRWHAGWKLRFPEEWREVVIGPHRADVRLPSGWVIELQSSPISPEEISERENFYQRMVWVLNGAGLEKSLIFRPREGFDGFRWKWPRRSWQAAQRPIFIDTGGEKIFRIRRIHWHEGYSARGWGRWVWRQDFVALALSAARAAA